MAKTLAKISMVGAPAQPVDLREWSTTLSNKLCALTQSLRNAGETPSVQSLQWFIEDNAVFVALVHQKNI